MLGRRLIYKGYNECHIESDFLLKCFENPTTYVTR